ncbi:MAG: hypothetical protein Kow0080_20580 [Candidatus Promineifilaceae bacterium]
MNPLSKSRWQLLLLLPLALVLAACVRPVDRPEDTTTVQPAPVILPTATPETAVEPPTATPPAEEPTPAPETPAGETTEGEPPAAEEQPESEPAPAPPPESPTSDIIHTVQTGDTLYAISQKYGVSIQAIVNANGLANPNDLEIGQQLVIPAGGTAEASGGSPDTTDPATGERVHIVQAGENLFRIGLQYGFSVNELATYNNIADPTQIDVGQVIRIPPNN